MFVTTGQDNVARVWSLDDQVGLVMHAAIPRDYGLLAAVMPSASSVYLAGLSSSIQLLDLPVQSTRVSIPWNKVSDLQLSGESLLAVSGGTN